MSDDVNYREEFKQSFFDATGSTEDLTEEDLRNAVADMKQFVVNSEVCGNHVLRLLQRLEVVENKMRDFEQRIKSD